MSLLLLFGGGTTGPATAVVHVTSGRGYYLVPAKRRAWVV